MNINPELPPPSHQIYSYTGNYYESRRIIFTKLRLSSHDLAIERGRSSRTPRDNRLCVCGQIQTEEHIICECIVSADIRHMYPNVTFRPLQMFFSQSDLTELCTVTALIYEKFQ